MDANDHPKRVYLSLPISGYDIDERRDTAASVQRRLEAHGYEVYSPMCNGLPADAGTHAHMRRDFEMLLQCDAIYMMERWTHSKGCQVEFEVATAIGLEVYFEECFALPSNGMTRFK